MPPGGNTQTPPPTSQGASTRATRSNQSGNVRTRADLVDEPGSSVRTRESARSFLDKNGFLAKEDALSTEALSYALLSLAHSTPAKTLQEGARAVALLMMDDAARGVGTAVLQYVEKHLAPIFNKCKSIMSAIQVTTNTVKEPVEEAYRAVESITFQRENKRALRKESKSCRQTYAVALKGNVPFAHSSNLARARARRCQVLIDKDPNMEQNNLNGLSKRELVTKANEAVS